jgi:hypothetical protein
MSAMTEEEAKTKFCCAGRAVNPGRWPLCVASTCMAWRWETKAKANGDRVRAVKERRATTGCSLMEAVAWVDANDRVTTGAGYCGLAGVPTP